MTPRRPAAPHHPGHDRRLDGDPASCRLAAVSLRSAAARLRGLDEAGAGDEVTRAAERLATALDRYGGDLRQAQSAHARAVVDEAGGTAAAQQANAALALVGRARRRLRLACADILP